MVITNFNIRRSELIFDWCFKDVDLIWKKYINKEDFQASRKENNVNENKDEDEEEEENNGRGFIDSLIEESSKDNKNSEEDNNLDEDNNINIKEKRKNSSVISNSFIVNNKNSIIGEIKDILKKNNNYSSKNNIFFKFNKQKWFDR